MSRHGGTEQGANDQLWAAAPSVRPMKLALFSRNLVEGPMAAAFCGLAHAFAQNGVDQIELLSLEGAPTESPFMLPPQARLLRLQGGPAFGAMRSLRRYLAWARPDVLITGPAGPSLTAVTAMLLTSGWDGRLVLSYSSASDRALRYGIWSAALPVRLLDRFAHGSFAANPTLRNEIMASAGLAPERVGCFPSVVAPERATASRRVDARLLARWQRGLLFLTVARLEPKQNLVLLAAFAKVASQRDARLLIIGDGPGETDLRRRIAALGLDDRIGMLDHVATLGPYLRAADVFVTLSDAAASDQALSEAMRAGLPVIGSDTGSGGARFLLADGRAGLLVPQGDIDALAGALAQMAVPQIRGRYAQRARERAAAFVPRRVGADLLAFIDQLPIDPAATAMRSAPAVRSS